MATYNFFYNPTGGGLSLPPPVQQARLGDYYKKGQCSVPGCRNGHLDLLPRNKCQNCQAQLHYECTHNRDDNGLWCPYDCSNNLHINNQQLQLLHLQQQQQQQMGQQQQQQQRQGPMMPSNNMNQQGMGQPNLQQQLGQQPQPPLPNPMMNQQQQQMGQNNNMQQQQAVVAQQHQALQQQLQHHQQQLQQQVAQLQQLTGVPPMPNDLGVEGTNGVDAELEAAVAAAAFARGGQPQQQQQQQQQQHIPKRAGLNAEDTVDDENSEEDDDDDDSENDEDEDDLPPPPPRKRNKKGDYDATNIDNNGKPTKLSRRQQPPKTNITRTRYSNDFKMRVVSELEEPGYGSLSDISRHYQVAEQTLRDWMKNKDKIADAVARRGNMKANPVDHLKHVTDALLKYMDEHYAANPDQPITARMIAQKGNEIRNSILADDSERPYLTDGERKMTTRFSASLSWGKKWVRQYARPKTTQVPQDLEGLSKEELVRLLRSVAQEREALEQNQSIIPRKTGGGNDLAMDGDGNGAESDHPNHALVAGPRPIIPVKPSNLLPFIPSPPRVKVNTVYKVDQAKVRIADTLTALIKKKAHNWKGRPTTEMTEEVPTLEAARELMEGYPEINKTARSYRWQLTGEQIVEWLDCPKYVHPVKFEGKVVCTIGQPAYVYAFAGYDSMLAKYEQGTSTLTLKVKTFTAGTGNIPGCDEPVFLCNEDAYGN